MNLQFLIGLEKIMGVVLSSLRAALSTLEGSQTPIANAQDGSRTAEEKAAVVAAQGADAQPGEEAAESAGQQHHCAELVRYIPDLPPRPPFPLGWPRRHTARWLNPLRAIGMGDVFTDIIRQLQEQR